MATATTAAASTGYMNGISDWAANTLAGCRQLGSNATEKVSRFATEYLPQIGAALKAGCNSAVRFCAQHSFALGAVVALAAVAVVAYAYFGGDDSAPAAVAVPDASRTPPPTDESDDENATPRRDRV